MFHVEHVLSELGQLLVGNGDGFVKSRVLLFKVTLMLLIAIHHRSGH